MPEVISPRSAPDAVDVEQEKTYYWCACGRSKNQPYCDGSHQGTAYLCGCKKTGNPPFCDGSHDSL